MTPPRSINPDALLQRTFGINFYAPFSTQSGLGRAARGYLEAIRAADIPVDTYNIDYDLRPIQISPEDYDRAPRHRVNLIQVNADSIHHTMQMFRPGHFDDAYTIAVWAWELNVLRPDWYAAFLAVDEVWGLSDFNAAAIAAMAPVPVRTMPPAVLLHAADQVYDRAYFGLPDGFLFMTVFDVGSSLDRKNPYAVIDAFEQAFSNSRDVFLLLKFHSGHNDAKAVQQLMRYVQGRRNVIVRAAKFSSAEMDALQRAVDCLVSAHRAEGLGLNIAEFMLLGKPVIATGYSGNMDFTTEQNSYLISYDMRTLERTSGPYLPGYLWAEPSVDAIRRLMRRVVENPAAAAQIGVAAADTIRTRLSPPIVGARLRSRLDELGLETNAGRFVALAGAALGLQMPPANAVRPLGEPADVQRHPTISILVAIADITAARLRQCIASVQAQTYARWELCLCDNASTDPAAALVLRRHQGIDPRIRIMRLPSRIGDPAAVNAAALMASGGYILLLNGEDELAPDALHQIATIVAAPGIDIVYADEDVMTDDGMRSASCHKPDWSIEHLESAMYVGNCLIIKTQLFLMLGGLRDSFAAAAPYDLLLRASRHAVGVEHIDRVLYHRRLTSPPPESITLVPTADLAWHALEEHVGIKFGAGQAMVCAGSRVGTYRVRHLLRTTPSVCLAVLADTPGSDRNTVGLIRDQTRYKALDVLTVGMMPEGWAAQANQVLRQTRGEYIVWLADQLEVSDPDWLTALLEFTQNPEIGLVGGRIADAATMAPNRDDGDVICNDINLAAGLLAARHEILWQMGGLDESLGACLAPRDFGLRLKIHGFRVVYTPFAELRHRRDRPATPRPSASEKAAFRAKWGVNC